MNMWIFIHSFRYLYFVWPASSRLRARTEGPNLVCEGLAKCGPERWAGPKYCEGCACGSKQRGRTSSQAQSPLQAAGKKGSLGPVY